MDKQALKVDYGTVGRFAAGGAMAGAGTAALLNLVHMLREQRKEQLDKRDPETDSNTIVLNLPPKMGEYTRKLAFTLAEESTVSNDVMHDHVKPGFRQTKGKRTGGRWTNPIGKKKEKTQSQFEPASDDTNKDVSEPSVKEATGWPTLTLSALAAVGGTGAGVALIDKLYAMRRAKQLKEELDAAQNDYVSALSGKQASALDELFPIPGEKQADSSTATFGMLNYPLAAAALLTLMGAGGTAYITKKVLDEKLRESQSKGLELPEVKRIVFRSAPTVAPEQEGLKKMSEDELLSVKAAFFVMLDKLDSHTRVLGTPGVKEAQMAAGLSTNKLFSLSQGDIGGIMDALNKNPELARIIVRAGMSRRPIMKHFQWAADTTPGLALGKNRIRSFLNQYAAPQPQPTTVAGKIASAVDMATAMLVGKALGSSSAEDATKALLEKGVAAVEPKVEKNEEGRPLTDLSKVTVSGADPQAEAYIKANKIKIMKLLQTLAAEGKI